MKICLVSRKFDKNSGSAEWLYADRLKEELPKKGFEIFTIEQTNSDAFSSKFKKAFHDFVRIPYKILYHRIVNNVKIFQFVNENQAIYSFLARIMGAKTITYFHDLMRVREKKFSLSHFYFLFVYKMASLSDVIICNSSLTKKEFLDLYNKQEKNVKIIPCITHQVFPLSNNRKKQKIGYWGSLVNRKRLLKFIEIGREIKKRKLNLKIDIWGKGYLEKDLKEGIKKHDLQKIISIKGFAPYDEVNKRFNSFDFFVFPTEEEGLGLPIIEALTCGIPAFIFEDAIIPKEIKETCIVSKDETDLIKNIEKIRKNKTIYQKYSKKALKNSKNFNFETNLNKLALLYYNLK